MCSSDLHASGDGQRAALLIDAGEIAHQVVAGVRALHRQTREHAGAEPRGIGGERLADVGVEDIQRRKLDVLVETAHRVWG